MPQRLTHPKTEYESQQMLHDLGCSPPAATVAARGLLPVTLIVVSVAVIVGVVCLKPFLERHGLQLDVGSLFIAISLIAAVVQWRAAIDHQSMEKYEKEISAGNTLAEDVNVCRMMSHLYPKLAREQVPNYDRCRYVYLHLDNLEYALERYMSGLSSAYVTARGVMTFESKCVSEEFCERAKMQLRVASYSPVVHRAALHVIETFGQ